MKKLNYIFIILFIVMLIGCGESSSSTGPSATDYLNNGWNAFDSRNFGDSLSNFQSAVDKDSSLKEGYIGVALTYLESSSYNETDAETVIENNVLSSATGDNLTVARAILLGIKMKDISNTAYIHDTLYKGGLENTDSGWDYIAGINSNYGTSINIEYLKGYMINLSLGEVFLREENYLPDARTVVDKVLNYSNFSSLPAEVQTRANDLDSQLQNAGY